MAARRPGRGSFSLVSNGEDARVADVERIRNVAAHVKREEQYEQLNE